MNHNLLFFLTRHLSDHWCERALASLNVARSPEKTKIMQTFKMSQEAGGAAKTQTAISVSPTRENKG